MENKKRYSILNLFKSNNVTLLIVLVLVILVFTLLNNKYFSYNNAMNILYAASAIGLLAIGQTYLIIAGHIDLSSSSVAGFSGVMVALLIREGLPWFVALVIVLVISTIIGLINSSLVNVFKLQPFIATLAMSSVAQGMGYIICDGRSIAVNIESFIYIGSGRILGIPIPIIILVSLFIIFGFIMARTRFGRCVYMIGGNVQAAYLAGISHKRISTILYIISSTTGALAGVILAARMHAGAPTALSHAVLDAITVVILGGVALIGGVGDLVGVFIGLLLIQSFNNGLTVVGVSAFWQIVAKGTLLIVALIVDYYRRSRLR